MTESLLNIGFTQLWQLSLLILVVGVLARTVCRNRPHAAMVLWLLVLVKCVTPPIVAAPFGLFCRTIEPQVEPATPIEEGGPFAFFVKEEPTPPPVEFEYLPYSEPIEMSVPIEEPAEPLTTRDLLVIAWAIGTALVVLIAFTRVVLCLHRIKRTSVPPPEELVQRLEQLRSKLGIRRRVSLMITSSAIGPAVIGLFRLRIVVPEVIARDGADKLEPILAHELIHIRRGDLWVGLLSLIAKGLWWFHPLVWWVSKQISRDTERACDEDVLTALGCRPADYARSLLRVLEQKNELKAMPAFPGVRPVEITSQRMERIMSLRQGSRSGGSWRRRLLFVVAAAVVLPGAVISQDAKPVPEPKEAEVQQKQILIKATIIEAPIADIPDEFRGFAGVTVMISSPMAKLCQEHQEKLNKNRQTYNLSGSGDPWTDQLQRLKEPAPSASPGFGFTTGPQPRERVQPPSAEEIRQQFRGIITSGILKDGAAHPEGTMGQDAGFRMLDAKQLEAAIASVKANRHSQVLCAPKLICNEGQQASLQTASNDLISISVTPTTTEAGVKLEYQVEVTRPTDDGGKTVLRSETKATLSDGKALVQSGYRINDRELVVILEAEEANMAPGESLAEETAAFSNGLSEALDGKLPTTTVSGGQNEPSSFVLKAMIAEVAPEAELMFATPVPTQTVKMTRRAGDEEPKQVESVAFSVSFESVTEYCRFMAESHEVRILSRPQMCTEEGKVARIEVGQNVPSQNKDDDGFRGIRLALTPTRVDGKIVLSGNLMHRVQTDQIDTTEYEFQAVEIGEDQASLIRLKRGDSKPDLLLSLEAAVMQREPQRKQAARNAVANSAEPVKRQVSINALIARVGIETSKPHFSQPVVHEQTALRVLVDEKLFKEPLTATTYRLRGDLAEGRKASVAMLNGAEILSKPRIVTGVGQQGRIEIGQMISVSDDTKPGEVVLEARGVKLFLTPRLEAGKLTLDGELRTHFLNEVPVSCSFSNLAVAANETLLLDFDPMVGDKQILLYLEPRLLAEAVVQAKVQPSGDSSHPAVVQSSYRQPQTAGSGKASKPTTIPMSTMVRVSVHGAVRKSGVYEVPAGPGSLLDAIAVAGGLRADCGDVINIRRMVQSVSPVQRSRVELASHSESSTYRQTIAAKIKSVKAGKQLVSLQDGDDVHVTVAEPRRYVPSTLNDFDSQWSVGFSMAMPLGLRTAHTQVTNYEHRLRKARQVLKAAREEASYSAGKVNADVDADTRRAIAKLEQNVKSLELQLKAARSLVRPRQDLIGQYQVQSFGDQLIQKPGTNAPLGPQGSGHEESGPELEAYRASKMLRAWEALKGSGDADPKEVASAAAAYHESIARVEASLAALRTAVPQVHKRVKKPLAATSTNAPRAMVYPIADLVVPVRNNISKKQAGTINAEALAELKARIRSIEPASWKSAGGEFSVKYNEQTLSLVIRAPASTHGKIQQILDRLRKTKHGQVTLDISFLEAKGDNQGITLPDGKVVRVRSLVLPDLKPVGMEIRGPRLTLISGQAADIRFRDKVKFRCRAKIEGQTVVVTATLGDRVQSWVIPKGHTATADFTSEVRGLLGRKADHRTYRLLVRPSIVLEVEEALDAAQGVMMQTPPGIIQEQQEELAIGTVVAEPAGSDKNAGLDLQPAHDKLPSTWVIQEDMDYSGREFKRSTFAERLELYRQQQQGVADSVKK